MFHVQHLNESPEAKFGRTVAAHLEFLGLSQRKFAAMLSDRGMAVDASAISRMLKGNRAMRLSEVYTVAEALGISVKYLLPDLTSKREEVKQLQQMQDRLWRSMAFDMVKLVEAAQDVVQLLDDDPSLMDLMNSGKGPQLDAPRDYLAWAASRAQASYNELAQNGQIDPSTEVLFVPTAEVKQYLLDHVSQLLAPFIEVGKHPDDPEGLDGEHPAAS